VLRRPSLDLAPHPSLLELLMRTRLVLLAPVLLDSLPSSYCSFDILAYVFTALTEEVSMHHRGRSKRIQDKVPILGMID
jgi:hypothetical protein